VRLALQAGKVFCTVVLNHAGNVAALYAARFVQAMFNTRAFAPQYRAAQNHDPIMGVDFKCARMRCYMADLRAGTLDQRVIVNAPFARTGAPLQSLPADAIDVITPAALCAIGGQAAKMHDLVAHPRTPGSAPTRIKQEHKPSTNAGAQ
jgi:hypothetical protein